MLRKVDFKTAFGYWFIHFAVEVICFYTVYRIFNAGEYWWMIGILYDTLAFAPQSVIGSICEKNRSIRPCTVGGLLLALGAGIMLITSVALKSGGLFITLELIGLILLTIGNCFVHIAGALVTLRVSEGRLSESAIFVGGGSFGVITGRLLSTVSGAAWIPFVLLAVGVFISALIERRIGGNRNATFDFDTAPCRQNIAANHPAELIVLILGGVVVVRAYIGYGLPTAWNRTAVQTVFLFVFMGLGKMSGGVLSDLFGPRRVGIISCLLAVPLLLVSNNLMWLSLIAVALFSMTMAITLGGIVSVLPSNPGVAFGVTTIGLLLGTLPVFFVGMPGRTACNILIIVMSVLAAAGLWYCLEPQNVVFTDKK